jgi:opacity protein-like surface antigen
MFKDIRTTAFCTALALFTSWTPAVSSAQGFISPLIGYDFGDDSTCPAITGCEEKNLNIGVGFGTLGRIVGFELDISYARNFFGIAPGYSSSVLAAMSNIIVGPQIGPARPYVTGGLGLIKSNVTGDPAVLLGGGNNALGWDIGGGLMIFATENIGVRGDIRHFHSFNDLEILGFPIGQTKLDFGRASAAVVLRF